MELNRRNFLKGAAVTAAGAIAATTLGACASETQAAEKTGSTDSGASANTASAGSEYNTAETSQRKWAFEIAPDPIAESDIAETIEAEIIVVGAGTAGLVTACSAAEAGAHVVVATASTIPVSRGGSNNAVYCKTFEEQGYPKVPEAQYEKEIFCQTHKVDQRKWWLHYNYSETAMNWAISLMEKAGYGIDIEIGTPDHDDSLYLQRTAAVGWNLNGQEPPVEGMPEIVGKMQPLFVYELARYLTEDLGGEIFYKNVAEQLIKDGDRVTAVVCLREDGTYAKYVGSKAIVLATGDFSADRDMMHRYCPETAHYVSDEVYDGEPDYDMGFQYGGIFKGTGQKMGLWAGAAWQKSFPNCTMGAYWGPGPRNLYTNHYGLLMDRDGQRYMNEYCIGPLASQHIMMLPEQKAFAIWDAGYAKHEAVSGDWTNDSMMSGDEAVAAAVASWEEKASSSNKNYVMGDTIEEVVEKLGLPETAVETVKRYNELANKGVDEDFHKSTEHLHAIEEGPFFGEMTDEFGFLTVMGGLNTNINMQVCDADDNPIPGLYNVGTMVGDVFAGTYTFMIEGANYGMTCVSFGHKTGKYIVENE